MAAGGETQAKRAGKLRLELKSYVVQDYYAVYFRFNKWGERVGSAECSDETLL